MFADPSGENSTPIRPVVRGHVPVHVRAVSIEVAEVHQIAVRRKRATIFANNLQCHRPFALT